MNSIEYERGYRVTKQLVDGNVRNLRYLSVAIQGIYCSIVHHYGGTRSDDTVQGMKDYIYDFVSEKIFDGCEPTFMNEDTYNWWINLKDNCFEKTGFDFILKEDRRIENPVFEQ